MVFDTICLFRQAGFRHRAVRQEEIRKSFTLCRKLLVEKYDRRFEVSICEIQLNFVQIFTECYRKFANEASDNALEILLL